MEAGNSIDFPFRQGIFISCPEYLQINRVTTSDIICILNTTKFVGDTTPALTDSKIKGFRAHLPYRKAKIINVASNKEQFTDLERVISSETHQALCEELLEERRKYYEKLNNSKQNIDQIRNDSAVKIQAIYRGHVCRPNAFGYLRRTNQQISKLSLSELHNELCSYANKLNLKPIPGLSLQSVIKSSRRRKKIDHIAINRIVKFFRMIIARKNARLILDLLREQKRHQAACRITCFFQRLRFRKYIRNKDEKQRISGLTLIQSAIRRFIITRRVKSMKKRYMQARRLNDAAIVIRRSVLARLGNRQHKAISMNKLDSIVMRQNDFISNALMFSCERIIERQIDEIIDLYMSKEIDRYISNTADQIVSSITMNINEELIESTFKDIETKTTNALTRARENRIESIAAKIIDHVWPNLMDNLVIEDLLESAYDMQLRNLLDIRRRSRGRSILINSTEAHGIMSELLPVSAKIDDQSVSSNDNNQNLEDLSSHHEVAEAIHMLADELSTENMSYYDSHYNDGSHQSSVLMESSIASKQPDNVIEDLADEMISQSRSDIPSLSISNQQSTIEQQSKYPSIIANEQESKPTIDISETNIIKLNDHIPCVRAVFQLLRDGKYYDAYDVLVENYSEHLINSKTPSSKHSSFYPTVNTNESKILQFTITWLFGSIFMSTCHYADARLYFDRCYYIIYSSSPSKDDDRSNNSSLFKTDHNITYNTILQGIMYDSIGQVYIVMNKYDDAMEMFQKGIESFHEAFHHMNYKLFLDPDSSSANQVNYKSIHELFFSEDKQLLFDEVIISSEIKNNISVLDDFLGKTIFDYQSIESYYTQLSVHIGLVHYHRGDYLQVIRTIHSVYYYISTIRPYIDIVVVSSYLSLVSMIYHYTCHYDHLVVLRKKILDILTKHLNSNHSILLNSRDEYGRSLLLIGDYNNAYNELSQCYNDRRLIITSTINVTSNESIPSSQSTTPSQFNAMTTIKRNPAQSSHSNIPIISSAEYHPDIAESYNSLGYYYLYIGDLIEAYNYFEKSSLIREKIYGSAHLIVSESFYALGTYFNRIGQIKRSQIFFTSSQDIRSSYKFPDHHIYSIQSVTANILILQSKGRYFEAKQMNDLFLFNIEKFRTYLGDSEGFIELQQIQQTTNIQLLVELGQCNEALEYISFNPISNRNQICHLTTLNSQAKALCMKGDYNTARNILETGIQMIKESKIMDSHCLLWEMIHTLTDGMRYPGCYQLAAEYCDEMLQLCVTYYRERGIYTGLSLYSRAQIVRDIGLYDEAIEMYKKSLHYIDDEIGQDNVYYHRILSDMGDCERLLGHYDSSNRMLSKASDTLIQYLGKYHLTVLECICNLAVVLIDMGDKLTAKTMLLNDVIPHVESGYGANHPLLLYAKANVGVCESMNDAMNTREVSSLLIDNYNHLRSYSEYYFLENHPWMTRFRFYFNEGSEISGDNESLGNHYTMSQCDDDDQDMNIRNKSSRDESVINLPNRRDSSSSENAIEQPSAYSQSYTNSYIESRESVDNDSYSQGQHTALYASDSFTKSSIQEDNSEYNSQESNQDSSSRHRRNQLSYSYKYDDDSLSSAIDNTSSIQYDSNYRDGSYQSAAGGSIISIGQTSYVREDEPLRESSEYTLDS